MKTHTFQYRLIIHISKLYLIKLNVVSLRDERLSRLLLLGLQHIYDPSQAHIHVAQNGILNHKDFDGFV